MASTDKDLVFDGLRVRGGSSSGPSTEPSSSRAGSIPRDTFDAIEDFDRELGERRPVAHDRQQLFDRSEEDQVTPHTTLEDLL